MLGRLYEGQNCSAARALELVGERWSLLILRDALFRGYTRFSEFERSLGIAPNVLAKRLEAFVAADLMQLRPDPARPDVRQYLLTARGASFRLTLMALTQWGDQWVCSGPIDYVDGSLEEAVELRVTRISDGLQIDPNDVQVRLRS